MSRNIPIRAVALSAGIGLVVGGLVIALLGHLAVSMGSWTTGLVAAGIAISAVGLVAAIVGALGFAMFGSAKNPRDPT
ncbi:hypothetical protein EDF39_2376 [Frondihabitans sp. PhB161]|nr:hypothetical protein EDF37_1873 [Frondihabitans sp. PhB153]RPF05669.1 hypothetical protein EDF39_2376 [Frondihabitans sp. PhB161]